MLLPEGKIIKALSGYYYVKTEDGIYQCRGRGVFRIKNITPLVGDIVEFAAENETDGYILDVKERINELIRPPVANVDQAILVFSAKNPDFSTTLLDRFLVMIESKDIKPIIIITKKDLISQSDFEQIDRYIKDYKSIGYDIKLISSKDQIGIDEVESLFKDKISVFAGQSGVGKSTLLNTLRPDLELETNIISKHLGRGKHTTRHVELLEVGGGWVADTPGFSALSFDELEVEDLSYCFPEIRARMNDCKFRGCLHVKEPKCAVKEAVEKGEINDYRYEHYLTFLQEIKDRKPRYDK